VKTFRSLLSLAVFLVVPAPSSAAVPSTVNYQGRLTDTAGSPLAGSRVMSVRVYDSLTAGALLYSETLGNVPVDANGIYGFQFGAKGNGTSPAIAGTLGGATEHWLELTVDGATQQPRQKIQAVPFALVAKGLEDGSVTSAMIADGAIGLSKISGLGTAASANAADFAAAFNTALSGAPTAPTAAPGTNNSQIATTAFVLANSGSLPSGGSLTNVVYAKTYGVTADGITDDRLALQAAIDAAAAAATPTARATVMLPAGKIMVSRTTIPNPGNRPYWKFCILLKNNVNVIGQGIDSTTIQIINGTVQQTSGLFSDDVTGFSENITLKDFTMDSNATARGRSSEGEGINIKTGKNLWLQGVRVKNAEQDGFDLDGGVDITMVDCIAEDCNGCGLHLVSGGANKVLVSNSIFRRNGYVRRVQGGGGYAENGAGIDVSANNIVISNCLLENNVVEVQVLAGFVLMEGCVVTHAPTSLNLAALVSGWGFYGPIQQGTFEIRNCKIYSTATAPAIEVIQNFPRTLVEGCELRGRVVCTWGKDLILSGNYIHAGVSNVAVTLTSQTGSFTALNNVFENSVNHIRALSSNDGKVLGNTFKGASVDLKMDGAEGEMDNWEVIGNVFQSTNNTRSIHIGAGSSGGTFSNNIGSDGGFSVGLGIGGPSTNNRFINNLISTLSVDSAASTGNLFERNVITGAITHPGATTFAGNTWRGNTGAGCAGIFYGTITLVNGKATVATPAANLARRFGFTRQSPNASTAIGHLALGSVTAQTSFVINALSSSAAVDTGDLSDVYWEILE
jgi:hypothetical protein